MMGSSGAQIGAIMKYLPFGETHSGSVPTEKTFTGQRLDGIYSELAEPPGFITIMHVIIVTNPLLSPK
jgi:hypothetical protein